MSKLIEANEKIAEKVTATYKAVENAVVGTYKKVEEGQAIEDKFVETFLAKDGESVEEAKKRVTKP